MANTKTQTNKNTANKKHVWKKRVQLRPEQLLEKTFVESKAKKQVKMDSATKMAMASVPKAQRALWKRMMLNAQWHKENFEATMVVRTVKTPSGNFMDVVTTPKDKNAQKPTAE